MLKKLIAFVLIGSIGISSLMATDDKDNGEKDALLLDLVLQGIGVNHYKETDIDDEFSERVYTLFLQNMDYGKRFFTKEDIETFELYKYKLDDQMKDGSLEFMNLVVGVMEKRIGQTKGYMEGILDKPMNLEKVEDYETDQDKRDFAKNEAELKDQWRKYLKYQVVYRLSEKLDEQEKAEADKDTSVTIKPLAELEKEAREKILKTHNDWFHRLERQDHEDYRSFFLNAVAGSFDPHTNFFPPKDKENFDISMSGQLEGIGAQLREEGGYIKVSSIVPGSPSWKQGELEAGDLILKVAQGSEEPVDIVDMSIDDAVQLIRGPKGTEVRLTVKKLDATITIIPIIRDVVILEETYARSAILQKKNDAKHHVGYISLPKFYADFNKTGGRNSGADVKKEVLKLKEEGVDGIVIDLRNNGGGSLQDVVDMAGLFIKTGPIVQVKPRNGTPYLLEDRDPEVYFDGPLVILVNEFSASASEILAAAMQDHKRAIIIGSGSTFGKGTVQRFFDLDNFVTPNMDHLKPLGVVKLTTQKFYRVNGQTTQLKGVVPDIVLPDIYTYMDIGEKEEEYPLAWDVIEPAKYEIWDTKSNFAEVAGACNSRVKSNEIFNLILENALRLKDRSASTSYSLHLDIFRKEREKMDMENEKYKKISEERNDVLVSMLKSEAADIQADSSKLDRTNAWHKNIKKDIYIDEALCVIKDMIEMPKHPVTDRKP